LAEEATVVAVKLAKAGYWGGNVGRVKRAPIDEVLAAYDYENFCSDYEAADFELQKALAGHG
jgi:hypothetical protein